MNPLEMLNAMIEYAHAWHKRFWQLIELLIVREERAARPEWLEVPQDVSLQPIILDYKNRKHLFAYNPSGSPVTLTSDQGGEWNTSIPANGWANISFPPNTRLKASAANTIIKIKCT